MDNDKIRFYRGKSMSGVFKTGEVLILKFTNIKEIRAGDVVVYRSKKTIDSEISIHPEDLNFHDEAVHRVISVLPEGLLTRGDNNSFIDPDLVTNENYVGLVTYVERSGKLRIVHGNWIGTFHARLRYCWCIIRKLLTRLGGGFYRKLRVSGLVVRFWHPLFLKIRLHTKNEIMIKYVLHGRTVADWWPEKNRINCRKPYDLVIRCDGQDYKK